MDNFQFTALLASSPFSPEERRNFTVIFNSLTPERKVQIIDGWPGYLDQILAIKHKAKEERERIIAEGFAKITQMMSEAYVREQAEARKKVQEAKEQEEIARNVEFYNRQKKLEQIRSLERASERFDMKHTDPLAGLSFTQSEADTIIFPL